MLNYWIKERVLDYSIGKKEYWEEKFDYVVDEIDRSNCFNTLSQNGKPTPYHICILNMIFSNKKIIGYISFEYENQIYRISISKIVKFKKKRNREILNKCVNVGFNVGHKIIYYEIPISFIKEHVK